LLPSRPQPLLQRVYLLIEDFGLCHSGGISKRDRIEIKADSRSNAYPRQFAGFKAGTSALHDRWMCGLGAFQCPVSQRRLLSPCCSVV
jgi:hypothetical protein